MKTKTKKVIMYTFFGLGLPFVIMQWKYIVTFFAAIPYVVMMGFYGLFLDYTKSYDIDYEDKSTSLAGIDANGNGMRDDLERFGKEIFEKWDPLVLKAYNEWLRNLYIIMNDENVNDVDKQILYMDSLFCWRLLEEYPKISNSNLPHTQKDEFSQIYSLAFNTDFRKEFSQRHKVFRSLSVYIPEPLVLKYSCTKLVTDKNEMLKLQVRSLMDHKGEVVKSDISGKFFSEKPRLYENIIDFNYYEKNVKTRREDYEEIYNYLDDFAK